MKISANHESKISNEMLEIPQWQPDRFFKKVLKEYGSFTSIITGTRMSGKSNMVKFLLTSRFGGCLRDKFDTAHWFSNNMNMNIGYVHQGNLPGIALPVGGTGCPVAT